MTLYTPAEDAVIIELRPDKTYAQIAEKLPGRSVSSVRSRAQRLFALFGTKRGPLHKPGKPLPREWFDGDRDTRAGAAVFRAGVE